MTIYYLIAPCLLPISSSLRSDRLKPSLLRSNTLTIPQGGIVDFFLSFSFSANLYSSIFHQHASWAGVQD